MSAPTYLEPASATEEELRAALVVIMDDTVANAVNIHYATPSEWGGGRYLALPTIHQLVYGVSYMDCSRTIVCLGNVLQPGMLEKLGGADATSATFYKKLKEIEVEQVKRGDIGVIGVGGSIHAFMFYGDPGDGSGETAVYENGSEAGPRKIPLSDQLAYHAGQPVTFLRLPV